MIEKFKEIPFIEESKWVKVSYESGSLSLVMYDKVLWMEERLRLDCGTSPFTVFVRAIELVPILQHAVRMTKEATYLEVLLENDAVYKLAYAAQTLDMQCPCSSLPEVEQETLFDLSLLTKATLKNLIKPELQNIYIDEDGAVSCDFNLACLDHSLTSDVPVLLPPMLHPFLVGRWVWGVSDGYIVCRSEDCTLVCPFESPIQQPDSWWTSLRERVDNTLPFVPVAGLDAAVKRLRAFGDVAAIYEGSIQVQDTRGIEPFEGINGDGGEYDLAYLEQVAAAASDLVCVPTMLHARKGTSYLILSAKEEQE